MYESTRNKLILTLLKYASSSDLVAQVVGSSKNSAQGYHSTTIMRSKLSFLEVPEMLASLKSMHLNCPSATTSSLTSSPIVPRYPDFEQLSSYSSVSFLWPPSVSITLLTCLSSLKYNSATELYAYSNLKVSVLNLTVVVFIGCDASTS